MRMRMHLMGISGWEFVITQLERESRGWRSFLPWLFRVPLQKRGLRCKRSDFIRISKIILDLWRKGQQKTIDDLAIVCSYNGLNIPDVLLGDLDRESLLRTGVVDEKLNLSRVDQEVVDALICGGIDSFSGMWDPWDSLCQRVQ